ncbi:20S proteasome subunit alpha 7 [Rhizoctonia solani AG-1 IB]|uniref:Proteasome subunit alpha type n=1 Tax=Thanatephorus cucumeris (strain AG1-IB / isolate 7/3/14) TaxID=1108050 RepID=M5BRP7_THACB|nr:20S proteasome subunit alpha 7 [Rhizoctonia solani AG-1 IB]CEL59626.1 20S proteasome subunit alpha 7 [Rhizoctonia solani AG-1 IB]
MTAIGTGYDLSASTYSPDGRLFQIEYASKAVENSGTAIGLKVKDGIVLAVEKLVHSKLLIPDANRRIATVDRHIGMATSGLLADGRALANRARDEAQNYRDTYMAPVPLNALADRLGLYVQAYTLYSSVRPFGISTILGSIDKTGPSLYVIQPSGVFYGYNGAAVGKGRQLANTELEKLNLSQLTVREAVLEAARIIHLVHDDAKDKDFELELSWIGPETGGKHAPVPRDLWAEADRKAREALDADMED